MLFTTDKQTADDLSLFGKQGANAIYPLFNRCVTRGGALLLEDMFHHPLATRESILQRSNTFRHFMENAVIFPVPGALLDAAEPYLANTDERTRLQPADRSLAARMNQLVGAGPEAVMIQKGIEALAELLHCCRDFFGKAAPASGAAYREEWEAIIALLEAPELEPVWKNPARLSQEQLAILDDLFRFRHRAMILELISYLYQLDVYTAVAGVARQQGFCIPVPLPQDRLDMTVQGLYHPLVKNAVANNLHTDNTGNVLFLTGANMAGKSTFMKSLGIAMYLAHMGFPVAAESMQFTVMDGIYTTINLPDNLGMGASHFYAEVLRVKKMATELACGKRLFIIFDELFRGTNVKDAYEATVAIVQGFAACRKSLFLVSTHIVEAGEILATTCSNVRFLYLPTRMNGTQPVYTYKLENGITSDRHGMVIIRNEGILDILEAGICKK